MKLVKSLLLGSAAGLCAVAGAQAADLPMRKSAPVEYVRVCTAYGAGFFYIPGTDTCIRVGGRARFEYQYTTQRAKGSDVSGFRGLGRLNLDARTQTPYGTLRAFVRFDIASRTGGYLKSGTQERYSNAFFGTGQDTRNNAQKFVDVDKAFVQFMGFTAGKAASFFDFYAHDLELVGSSVGSDVSSTNLFAYTATFGGGFSATLSAEDPVFRRNPTLSTNGFNAFTLNAATTGIALTTDAFGVPTAFSNLNVIQNNSMPDVVGVLRYDQPWGSAQLSGAVHELRTGTYGTSVTAAGGAVPVGTLAAANLRIPSAEYGYALQGGLKLNVPQLAPGDVLWLQAAYAEGANSYTGIYGPQGQEALGNTYTNRFSGSNLPGGYDMAVDTTGRTHLTTSWSGTIAFLHYWTPEIRQGVFASYGRAQFDSALRSTASPLNAISGVGATFGAGGALSTAALFSGFGKDYSNIYVGSNLIWSPVRDLDIGVEAVYERIEFLGGASGGRVVDANKAITLGGTPATVKYDDNVLVRMRVQRDF